MQTMWGAPPLQAAGSMQQQLRSVAPLARSSKATAMRASGQPLRLPLAARCAQQLGGLSASIPVSSHAVRHGFSSVPNACKVQTAHSRASALASQPLLLPAQRHSLRAVRRGKATRTQAGLGLAAAVPYVRDLACVVAAAVGAKVWTKLFDLAVKNGLLEKNLSRKLVHTTTGPIFLLTFPLFSAAPWARYFAAVVPMLNAARLLAVGSGAVVDEGLVKSVSRSGEREELLKGPLYYCLVLIATTLLCWRDNPVGLIVVSLMCGGDGLADIVGRRWGSGNKLPYNNSKSLAGSAAMLFGGTVMAAGLMTAFCTLGFFECYATSALLPCLLGVALAATVVESLPINQWFDDNLSVPLVTAAVAMLLLPHVTHTAGLMAAAL